jgi:hypothetical protein
MTEKVHDLVITAEDVATWTTRYIRAWETNDRDDIAGLFTHDAEYHESPYATEWVGRDAIVEGWQSRWNWQQGGWNFEWHPVSIVGSTAVVNGVGRYDELGTFDNSWTIRFRTPQLCADFVMVNTERVG